MTPEVEAAMETLSKLTGGGYFLWAAAVQVLADEIARLEGNYAKLHGVITTYIDADPMVKGEAFRDLAATLAHLEGYNPDYGWPAVYDRQIIRIAALETEVARLKAAQRVSDPERPILDHIRTRYKDYPDVVYLLGLIDRLAGEGM